MHVSLAMAHSAGNIDFRGRLGEREKAGAEAHFRLRAEKTLAECGQNAAQVSQRDVVTDHKALDLMKHGGVRDVGVPAENLAGSHNGDRRTALFHGVDLHAGGLGTKDNFI